MTPDRRGGARAARRPGALLLIALCFAGSAVARATDPDGVVAREAEAAIAAPPGAAEASCAPPEAGSLLAAVREREAQLAARAEAIASRARVLEAAEARFAAQSAALESIEERLAATLAIADDAAESDLQRLVSVYEAMKPKNAAPIFESMDVTFAAGFLARMQRDASARILAELSPAKAYAVSVVIAGRNASAPTQ